MRLSTSQDRKVTQFLAETSKFLEVQLSDLIGAKPDGTQAWLEENGILGVEIHITVDARRQDTREKLDLLCHTSAPADRRPAWISAKSI